MTKVSRHAARVSAGPLVRGFGASFRTNSATLLLDL
jgi:hypothetical protein